MSVADAAAAAAPWLGARGLGRAAASPTAEHRHHGTATGDTAAPGETDYQWTPNPDLLAGAEGEVNVIAWAGYIEDGSTDPGGRLGDAVRGHHRLCRQRAARQHVRRDGRADAERRVRRRVGVR